MNFFLHVAVLMIIFSAMGILNVIERRAADRSRLAIPLRLPIRRFFKVTRACASLLGSVLVIGGLAGISFPLLPPGIPGNFVASIVGAYTLGVAGMLRLVPLLFELRIVSGGLWWGGRFFPWNGIHAVEVQSDAIRVHRMGSSGDLMLPSSLWDVDPGSARRMADLITADSGGKLAPSMKR